tara:strand:- start:954 stop:1871 length:918 start_codon:yes stop_codon:yes gene_type:complete
MKNANFHKAKVYVIAQDKGIRQSLKTVLFSKGFRTVQATGSLDLLVDAINLKDLPDLVITDVDFEDQDACELIFSIRNKRFGDDPYLPVVGMAWNPQPDLIHKVINAGFDFFVAKPFSAQQISERIEKIVYERQPFVVTGDYLGPNRHKDANRESKIPAFEVPNSLKSTAVDNLRKSDHRQKIRETNKAVNQQRLNQLAADIERLVALIVPDLDAKKVDSTTVENLDQLLEMLKHTRFHAVKDTQADIRDLCVTFYRTVKSLLTADGEINLSDVKKLQPLSDAVTAGLTKTQSTDDPSAQEQQIA